MADNDLPLDDNVDQSMIDALAGGGNEDAAPGDAAVAGSEASDEMSQLEEAAAAFAAEAAASSGATGAEVAAAAPMPDLTALGGGGGDTSSLDLLGDVELRVTVELGRTEMLVEDVLRLGEGSVVELDKLAGDPVDVFVNGRLIARGEVLVLNDSFCIRISEIVDDLHETAEAAIEDAALVAN